jgi:hypothetical protein
MAVMGPHCAGGFSVLSSKPKIHNKEGRERLAMVFLFGLVLPIQDLETVTNYGNRWLRKLAASDSGSLCAGRGTQVDPHVATWANRANGSAHGQSSWGAYSWSDACF